MQTHWQLLTSDSSWMGQLSLGADHSALLSIQKAVRTHLARLKFLGSGFMHTLVLGNHMFRFQEICEATAKEFLWSCFAA